MRKLLLLLFGVFMFSTNCIYDLQGKMLKQIPVTSGMTSVTAYSQELGTGIFLCYLNANGKEIETKRIVISK